VSCLDERQTVELLQLIPHALSFNCRRCRSITAAPDWYRTTVNKFLVCRMIVVSVQIHIFGDDSSPHFISSTAEAFVSFSSATIADCRSYSLALLFLCQSLSLLARSSFPRSDETASSSSWFYCTGGSSWSSFNGMYEDVESSLFFSFINISPY
jgi:hypothetical protein